MRCVALIIGVIVVPCVVITFAASVASTVGIMSATIAIVSTASPPTIVAITWIYWLGAIIEPSSFRALVCVWQTYCSVLVCGRLWPPLAPRFFGWPGIPPWSTVAAQLPLLAWPRLGFAWHWKMVGLPTECHCEPGGRGPCSAPGVDVGVFGFPLPSHPKPPGWSRKALHS